jgi:NAD(P)H dehydrogenase (quinone)
MTKVLILFYSSKGNTEKMAAAVKEGAAKVPDTEVTLIPVKDAAIDDLPEYDAIIIGTPVYFGTMAAPVKDLFDRSGRLQGMLAQKVGGAFASAGQFGGGSEAAVLDILKAMLCHGMIIQGDTFNNHFGAVAVGAPEKKAAEQCQSMGKRLAELAKLVSKAEMV